jgi:hypothetical protein
MTEASFTVLFTHTVVSNLTSSYAVIAKVSICGSNMAEARSPLLSAFVVCIFLAFVS